MNAMDETSRGPVIIWPFLRRHFLRILISLLLASVVYGALSVWMSYRREQRISQTIRGLGGRPTVVYRGPGWISSSYRWRFPFYKRIDTVSLHKCRISTELLRDLQSLVYLESLDLSGTDLTASGAKILPGMTGLRLLDLSSTPVGDAELEALQRLTRLRYLALNHTQVTDAGLRRLAALPMLEGLELIRTNVTDEGLDDVQRMTKLNTLLIDRTKVTDIGLEKLKVLVGLRYLWVDEKTTTPKARAALKEALPDCRIRFGP